MLPHRVDESRVSAKLADGILVVTVPKASPEDSGRVKVNID
jgi:HSP20 family molecular chaperone IbpA